MAQIDPDRWRIVGPYLDQALELPDAERSGWLVSLEARDRELAAEVRGLLAEHRELAEERFLEDRPMPLPVPVARAGQRVGAYTLLLPIGKGGMGTVWLAERSDGRFERRAAIKFLNAAFADRAAERFKREGLILGRLAHPHIAQLIDAGISLGQPYLVLEYVEGEPIDRYCEGHRVDLEGRIRLFLDVLSAVSNAHAHLVVHRDIKPSNVLVGQDGRVKLLDFGIAKLLEEDTQLGGSAALTREGGAGLTPEYAAPEQLTGAPITTATDVYALGVLLYVLLSGRHPAGNGPKAPADLVRAIIEVDPPRLSAVESVPDTFRRRFRGDLDTIVHKALRKQPEARYASVAAMADDLRRYLRHEPIGAVPETITYRARKFVRRHRWSVSVAALMVCALSLALYIVNRERTLAERRFTQVRQLANRLFDIDAEVRTLAGGSKARQVIVDTSLEYLRRLSADASSDTDLALELGTAYIRVGRVQGVPLSPNLGQFERAEESLRTAEELIARVLAAQPANRTALLRLAEIHHDRMLMADQRAGTHPEALALARKSGEWLERYLSSGPLDPSPDIARSVVVVGGNVANIYAREALVPEAVTLARRITAIARATNQPVRAGTTQLVAMRALRSVGDLEAAMVIGRQAMQLLEPPAGEQRMDRKLALARALDLTGQIAGEDGAVSLGRRDEAIRYFERAFAIASDAAQQDATDYFSRIHVASSGLRLAHLLRSSDAARSARIYDQVIAAMREIKNNSGADANEVTALARSSYPLRQLGLIAEAGRRLNAAMVALRQMHAYPAPNVSLGSEADETLRAHADYEAGTGHVRAAIAEYDQLLRLVEPLKSEAYGNLTQATDLSNLYQRVADLERQVGETTPASSLDIKRIELWRRWQRRHPSSSYIQQQLSASLASTRLHSSPERSNPP
jgi:serine/threonine-protein kinase